MLVYFLGAEYFKDNFHYLLLTAIPHVSAEEIAQQFSKFGEIAHVLKMRRAICEKSDTCSYAYIGYDNIRSVVYAVHQGKYWGDFFVNPKLARWAFPDDYTNAIYSTFPLTHTHTGDSFCEECISPPGYMAH